MSLGNQIKSVFVILITGFFLISCDRVAGVWPESTSTLSNELAEEGWPVYPSWCIVFQAPEEASVSITVPDKDPVVNISLSEGSEEVSPLIRIYFKPYHDPNFVPSPPDIIIGGMNAYREEMTNDGYSGEVVLETPLAAPGFVIATYSGLNATQRELAVRIIETIRIDVDRMGLPEGYSDSHDISHRYNPEPEWDVVPNTSLGRSRTPRCRGR